MEPESGSVGYRVRLGGRRHYPIIRVLSLSCYVQSHTNTNMIFCRAGT